MARQKVRITRTTHRRRTGGKTGYRKCNMCHGTGRVKIKK